ncbi:hypothetical protein I4U23_011889 [Adineta vaga]|nr:hypothetical protein I4U23_011889 [Adineta vaga]
MDDVHDKTNSEFKIELNKASIDKTYLTYELNGSTIDFQHTYVPPIYRGKGRAENLVLSTERKQKDPPAPYTQLEQEFKQLINMVNDLSREIEKRTQSGKEIVEDNKS